MTGSMYASIAGLKAHMQKLTVIGNNIANVNTQGYKRQRTIFRDSIYSMYSSGSNGTTVVGGMNPSQLGYGSLVASIDLDMSSASYSPGNPSDCALVGDGFFLVGNKDIAGTIDPTNPDTFKALTLSRLGDFFIGPDGYLVDGQGNVVYGFMNTNAGFVYKDPNDPTAGTLPDISDQLVPIRLPHYERVRETIEVDDGNGGTTQETVERYVVRYAETKTRNADGTYPAGADTKALEDVEEGTPTGTGDNATVPKLEYVDIDGITIDAGSGCITATIKETNEQIVIGYLAVGTVTNPNGVSHVNSSYYTCGDGAGELRVGMLGGVNRELGLSYVNSYMGATDDGQGGTTTVELPYGSALVSNANTQMMVGFLESSNTDLATEIAELITTQRGYQANTRIVTVTDSMLEELVNMKR